MSVTRQGASSATPPGIRRCGRGGTALAVVEVLLAAVAVARDLWLPTLVLLAMAALSLALRREGPASLGFHRLRRPGRAAVTVVALTVAWTVLKLLLVIPVLEHVTGQRQDLRQFAELHGNWSMLLSLLALSWTLAALGEEAAYRGYLLTRLADVLGSGRVGMAAAVVASSALFALAHIEQGVVGVILTFLDALLLAGLRLWFGTLWAPVLAHGVNNTLGLTTFALIGPVYGLW